MSKIKIKNFGPIKEGCLDNDGWLDVKKVTVFIGNQGSGKSTLAKVISTMKWFEKALNRDDMNFSGGISINDFQRRFEYHGMKDYFSANTVIDYIGEKYRIVFDREKEQYPRIELLNGTKYIVPKIMYVPSERNFLSVVKDANSVRGLPEPLFEFAEELKRAQNYIGVDGIELPINNVRYKHDLTRDVGIIYNNEYSIEIKSASSGFQSLAPMFLVSYDLSKQIANSSSDLNADIVSVNQKIKANQEILDIMNKMAISNDKKIEEVEKVKSKFISKCFINIVEEPEQNLFPSSQREILNSLLEFNNLSSGNELIITTHSPYIINFLSIAIQGEYLLNKIKHSPESINMVSENIETSEIKLEDRLNKIVPTRSVVSSDDVGIYELDEKKGIIKKLPTPEGIPSDNNYLNQSIRLGNEMFDSLLEIEQEL